MHICHSCCQRVMCSWLTYMPLYAVAFWPIIAAHHLKKRASFAAFVTAIQVKYSVLRLLGLHCQAGNCSSLNTVTAPHRHLGPHCSRTCCIAASHQKYSKHCCKQAGVVWPCQAILISVHTSPPLPCQHLLLTAHSKAWTVNNFHRCCIAVCRQTSTAALNRRWHHCSQFRLCSCLLTCNNG